MNEYSRATLKLENCEATLPSDCKYLAYIYIPNYKGLDEYYINLSTTIENKIYIGQEWNKLKEINIKYVPFDEEKIKRAMLLIKELRPDLSDIAIARIVLEANEDDFENYTLINTHYTSEFITNHEKFMRKVKTLLLKYKP